MFEMPQDAPYSTDAEFAQALIDKDRNAQKYFFMTFHAAISRFTSKHRSNLGDRPCEETASQFEKEILDTNPVRYLRKVAGGACSMSSAIQQGLKCRLLDQHRKMKTVGKHADRVARGATGRGTGAVDPQAEAERADRIRFALEVVRKSDPAALAFALLLWRFRLLADRVSPEQAEKTLPWKADWQILPCTRSGLTLQEAWEEIKRRVGDGTPHDAVLADVLGITVDNLQKKRQRLTDSLREAEDGESPEKEGGGG